MTFVAPGLSFFRTHVEGETLGTRAPRVFWVQSVPVPRANEKL